jgi:hypothetical protein
VEVVDDEHRARREQREERAQEAAREAREVGRVFGAEARQAGEALRARRQQLRGGERQVVKERAGIGIAGIGLEPDAGRLARIEVARDERRLACAGRPGDPYDRVRARGVEPLEQALAPQHVVEPRAAEFCKRDGSGVGGLPRHGRRVLFIGL